MHVDAEELHDAAQCHELCRQTARAEVFSVCERLNASLTTLRWVSSERQVSDGLTDPSARQVLAD